MALPRAFRLRSCTLINLAYQKGVSYKTPFFRIQYRKKNGRTTIAFVVSKKTEPRAVIRNALKRRVSAAFYSAKQCWQDTSFDVVVAIFPSALTASFAQLVQAVSTWKQKIQPNTDFPAK